MLLVKRSLLGCITESVDATPAGFASPTGVLQNLAAFLFIGVCPVAWYNNSLKHTIPVSRTPFKQRANPTASFRSGRRGVGA